MARQKRIVGIDLGTTNTAVAWQDPHERGPAELFRVPQLVSAGEVDAQPLFPSFLYAPTSDEVAPDPFGDAPWVLGEHARRRGRAVPGRTVASAKSWLSHPSVDRQAPILPWGDPEDPALPRLSPVEASTRLLLHVRRTWDAAHPEYPLAEQQVVLTVPASFDEVARELTVLAAERAGLTVRLLEEPQAAFYAYLAQRGTEELAALLEGNADSRLVLVCDVGGGTTDLTLIRVHRGSAGPELSRVAVGRHLLLGGDNIDLALAHLCEARIAPDTKLDPARFGQLVLACRAAKEQLLGAEPPSEVPIRVLQRGSALVGGTLATTLTRDDAERLVFDGFLPAVTRPVTPERARTGLLGFGLPYERDPAITRHVLQFFDRHAPEQSGPDAVLLNGGLFRAPRAATRLVEALSAWSPTPPRLLSHSDPDLAVAFGAVAYGLSLLGRGTRIGGGTARGYYVAVAGAEPSAAKLLCIVPRGAAESERHVIHDQPLALRTGEPVRFELYASDSAGPHAPGTLVEPNDDYDRLPPVVTTVEAGEPGSELRVALEGELTPVGTVELSCLELSASAPRRFRLAFDLRQAESPPARPSSARSVSRPKNEAAALDALDRVFGKSRKDVRAREVKDLVRELERLLGERPTWTSELNRTLFDALAPQHAARKRSPDHERVFWMLAGYCLRPGIGHPHDDRRIQRVAPLIRQGLTFPDEARGWQQFWIALRRTAAGLPEATQIELRNLIDPFLAPAEAKLKKVKGWKPQALDEMLELASWLERVPAEGRAVLGRWLLERTWTSRDPRLWGALGRIGARVPTYASVHHVIATTHAERWLDHLLRERWEELPSAPRAALELARVTGDRARDVPDALRLEVARHLERAGAPAEWIQAVRELVTVDESERRAWYGEELPVGLRLVGGEE